jgi:hypothetical protein
MHSFEWDMLESIPEYNSDLVPSCSHKTKCIVHQSNNNMLANGTSTIFQFDTFPTALQNAIGQGGKSDVRLAKHFVQEKLSKKVQFMKPNNDDMMKKVCDGTEVHGLQC